MDTETSETRAALEATWPWKEGIQGQVGDPVGKIRRGAIGHGLIGALIGTGLYFFLSNAVGLVAWSLSGLLALICLISPTGLYRKIQLGLETFGTFVGLAMAWVLLVPVYCLLFTPFRFLFRCGKKDAMTRWLEPDSASYWVTRGEGPSKQAYERQF